MRYGKAVGFTLALALALSLSACGGSPEGAAGKELAAPSETQPLVVATRNAATAYVFDRHGKASGPEYDLVAAFAAAQGMTVEWKVLDTTAGVLQALEQGKAHMAAAGLSRTEARDARFLPGGSYREVQEELVCQRGQVRGKDLEQLPEGTRILVGAGTSYADSLQDRNAGAATTIAFDTTDAMGTERLLAAVAQDGTFCTVADDTIVAMNRRIFPNLDVVLDIGAPRALAWYVAPGHAALAEQSAQWMRGDSGQQAITAMGNRYYDYISEFDFVDLRALNRKMESELPAYKPLFQEAAERTELAPDLLAAQAYQESHWDPTARSPTGVRGIMMLTQNTAKSLGVEDRLDPEQAIDGGARYLADQRARLPDTIPEPDRSFLALAAYNVGRAHLLDARKLARELGRDPDSWADMREVLPLLSEPDYYKDLKYGYARGHEPVQYVQRIRNYRDVIANDF
ncbi:membrane-bound lytic murein transglycosylase MltF [Algiphilus sp.]|uniref:membrane-bound lytic murein transglycosylase MltF n=1 Tax=Algiphilus sp. TaxID=1872431 RepID=UPI003B5187EF